MTRITPVRTNSLNGGIQKIYKFDNGYGASVIKNAFSYGWGDDLWELAVIKFKGAFDWEIVYDTEITDDVVVYLTEDEVQEILKKIREIEKDETTI